MLNRARVLSIAFVASLLTVADLPAVEYGLVLDRITLNDNGDGDLHADTNETVTLTIRFRNTTGEDLSEVAATLFNLSPDRVCVTDDRIVIGDLADGDDITPVDSFEIHVVEGADRDALGLTAFDPFSAQFRIEFDRNPLGYLPPILFELELDLNVSGGSGSMSYFESFEAGLNTFEVQNLDTGLGGDNAASDGYRCQFNDPDWMNSNSYNSPYCYLGYPAGQNEATYWQANGPGSPQGGRAFSGAQSLYYGIDLGPGNGWTTPSTSLEAVAMSEPVYLPVDGNPVLSFKHQVRLADGNLFNNPPDTAVDRGVVMVQRADENDDPVGPWIRIEAMTNGYDAETYQNFITPQYDPVDDGTTEDDFWSPNDPDRRHGPSSTCWPNKVYAAIGETELPFDPGNVGNADGPGLAGSSGLGTWVESRFDLSGFRGQRIRVRFLVSAMRGIFPTREDYATNIWDNGWWIDDVTIDDTTAIPATIAIDTTDNSGLPQPPAGDVDGDGTRDVCDNCSDTPNPQQFDDDYDSLGNLCDVCPFSFGAPDADFDSVCDLDDNCLGAANPQQIDDDDDGFGPPCDCNDDSRNIFPGALEINDGVDQSCDGLADEISGVLEFPNADDKETIVWPAQTDATRYNVARGDAPDFSGSCETFTIDPPEYVDASVPPAGAIYYYLARARKPIIGSWGAGSSGVERDLPCD